MEIYNYLLFSSDIHIFVYQMGRLCGGAHEISGIKGRVGDGGVQSGGGVVGGVIRLSF